MAAADHVGMLHAMFPDVGTDTISMVLESTNNDPDAAVELLLGMSDPSGGSPPAPPAPPAPTAPAPQRLSVQVPPGMQAGQRIQFQRPGGGLFTATIPHGVPVGGTFMVDVGANAAPPPPVEHDQPFGMTEDEQLALALAESAALNGPAEPHLGMAVAAEREAIRQTADDERARQRAQVTSNVMRVAGDSRGTASTLVGLTPEEELELAMLKSAVAAEQGDQPPELPPTWQPAATPSATPAQSAFAQPLAPLGPLPPMVPLAPPPAQPAPTSKPPKKAAASGALAEGLLGSDHLEDLALAPLVLRPMGAPLGQQAPAAPAYQPPLVPTMAPTMARRGGGAADGDEDWDDVDRPLSGLLGGQAQPEANPVKAGVGRSYAQLE